MPPENTQPAPESPNTGQPLPGQNGELPMIPAPEQPATSTPRPLDTLQPTPLPTTVPQLHPQTIKQDFAAPETPKDEADRYAFFMNTTPKTKQPIVPLPPKSNRFAWIIIGAVGFFALLIVASVIISAARSSGNKNDTASLTGIIGQQQEIIRVSQLGMSNVQSTDLANFVATTNAATTSNQSDLISYVTQHGGKINNKALLTTTQDPATDKALDAALAASVYDSTFRRIMLDMLTTYQTDLEKADGRATTQAGKTLLDDELEGAKLLRGSLAAQN